MRDVQGDSKLNMVPDIPEQVKEEISLYLKHSTSDRSSDLLQFWKQNSSTFPLLAKAALTMLAIQAKSCLLERVYLVGGQILIDMHHNLLNNNADALIFFYHNA